MIRKNILLILILSVAIFLRFFRLDYLELFGDELDAGYQAYSLSETARDYKGNLLPFYADSFAESRAPFMMYSMVPFIKVFGLNEWSVRGCTAFFGVLSLLGFYFLMMRLGVNNKVSLLTTFLLAILPWHIQYSRSGFELTVMSGLIVWGLYFLIGYLNKNKFWKLFLAAILLSLSFYTYNTANVYVPCLLILVFISNYLVNKKFLFKRFFNLLVIMFIFSLPILFQIFFGSGADRFKKFSIMSDDNIVVEINSYRQLSSNSLLSKVFYNKPVYAAKKIVTNYTNAFGSEFLFARGDVTFRHSLHKVGELFWIEGVFILVGLVLFFKKNKKQFFDYFMIGFLLISPIPSSLTVDGAYHASRLFLMIFPLAYFAANGLIGLFKFKKIIGFIAVLIMCFEFSYFQFYYWNSYASESWRWWHYGYKETIQNVVKHESDFNKVYIENTYEPALIRYLFWHKTDPQLVFGLDDKMKEKAVNGYDGFCLNDKTCFVNFGGRLDAKKMKTDELYVISHSANVGGDWDWSKNPPEEIKVLETIRNPLGENLFYLVCKK